METSAAISATTSGPALRVRENCTGCGGCFAACSVGALTLTSEKPGGWGRKLAKVDNQRCQRCGDCLSTCPRQSLSLG